MYGKVLVNMIIQNLKYITMIQNLKMCFTKWIGEFHIQAFSSEPFGYSIFEAVDKGKLPILHSTWCKDLEYPYRASSKKEFQNIYKNLCDTSYEEKLKWFNHIKSYMINNFSNKQEWVNKLLDIYNIGE